MSKLKIAIVVFIAAVLGLTGFNVINVTAFKQDRSLRYYSISEPRHILKRGENGTFDSDRVHTMSIVELNKNGHRFWSYYHGYDGKNIKNDMGLAYSNNLEDWQKEGNKPIIPNLRWGTAVVADGIVNLFGTRNYGSDSYIVRLTSEDGKNFKEIETVVAPKEGERHQNSFIFYDERNATYRLYYYHFKDNKYYIEEKHSKDITQLADADENVVLSDSEYILAAPSVMNRNGRYWLAAETLHEVNGKQVWKTIVFSSRYPNKGFTPVENHEILVNSDACYFQYIFDNVLNGIYSHEGDDGKWEMYRRTYEFKEKNKLDINDRNVDLDVNKDTQLNLTVTFPDGSTKDVTENATWATSDNSVITVKKGRIKALRPGKAIITASYGGCSITSEIHAK